MPKRTLTVLYLSLVIVVVGLGWLAVISQKHQSATSTPILSVTAFNQTKNAIAESITASPQDLILYTLSAENPTNKVIANYRMEVNISDLGDKATLIDANGASFDSSTSSLVWNSVDIPASGSIQKQFSVKINELTAANPNPVIKISFNNVTTVGVSEAKIAGVATTQKASEPYKAPKTGPGILPELVFALLCLIGAYAIRKLANNSKGLT